MKVVVIGGGVVGVTTAYYLSRRGHAVTLIERASEAATRASRATGGHIAPGHSGAWASPRALKQLKRSLLRRDTAFRLRLGLDWEFLKWTAQFRRNCTQEKYWQNSVIKSRLTTYSRQLLIELRSELGIEYDEAASGAIFLFRSEEGLEAARQRAATWAEHGLTLSVLEPGDIRQLDPRLDHVAERMAGALHSEIDEVGDTRWFTHELVRHCAASGVEFLFDTEAVSIQRAGDSITGVVTSGGVVTADAYVVANGVDATGLLRPLGLPAPVYPLRGYTLTFPQRNDRVPTIGMVDEERLVAIARLGDRVRLGGVADLAPKKAALDPTASDYMIEVGRELFPDGADWDSPDTWACERPMTPDGPPILGRSPFGNLLLNIGHGHIGWTMACGSAEVIADLIDDRTPAVDLEGMTVDRF